MCPGPQNAAQVAATCVFVGREALTPSLPSVLRAAARRTQAQPASGSCASHGERGAEALASVTPCSSGLPGPCDLRRSPGAGASPSEEAGRRGDSANGRCEASSLRSPRRSPRARAGARRRGRGCMSWQGASTSSRVASDEAVRRRRGVGSVFAERSRESGPPWHLARCCGQPPGCCGPSAPRPR